MKKQLLAVALIVCSLTVHAGDIVSLDFTKIDGAKLANWTLAEASGMGSYAQLKDDTRKEIKDLKTRDCVVIVGDTQAVLNDFKSFLADLKNVFGVDLKTDALSVPLQHPIPLAGGSKISAINLDNMQMAFVYLNALYKNGSKAAMTRAAEVTGVIGMIFNLIANKIGKITFKNRGAVEKLEVISSPSGLSSKAQNYVVRTYKGLLAFRDTLTSCQKAAAEGAKAIEAAEEQAQQSELADAFDLSDLE